MARIPDHEIERLKKEISVERLAEARGIQLTRHGADLVGKCPFHDDRTPSLVITPAKNLWHCLGACNARSDDGLCFPVHGGAEWIRPSSVEADGVLRRFPGDRYRWSHRPNASVGFANSTRILTQGSSSLESTLWIAPP
jgi:hypothetical protein